MYNDMVRIYGDRLPDIDHEPLRFAYYVRLYKYHYMK